MPTVAIIRPKAQLDASCELVEAYGYDTAAMSLIELVAVADRRWGAFVGQLRRGSVDYVVFSSANGVHCSVARGLVASDVPAHARIVAIGPPTQRALLSAGFRVDAIPQEFSSDGLLTLLNNVGGCRIWLLRSAYGSVSLIDELRRRGAAVNEVTMYTLKQLCGETQRRIISSIVEGDVAAVLFTSSMTVRGFFTCALRQYDRDTVVQALRACLVAAIGKPTETTLKSFGVRVDVVPAHATFPVLVSSVHEALLGKRPADA